MVTKIIIYLFLDIIEKIPLAGYTEQVKINKNTGLINSNK